MSHSEREKFDRLWTILWFSTSFSWLAIALLALFYSNELNFIFNSKKVIVISYSVVIISWTIFRIVSKFKARQVPDFMNKFSSDIVFAKKYNYSEFGKLLVSYFLVAVPLCYATGIAKPILAFLGVNSTGFDSDLENFIISVVATFFNLFIGIIGSYIYDRIKQKLP